MKTFDDWWTSRKEYSVYEQYEDAKDAWEARQPEIDELKKENKELRSYLDMLLEAIKTLEE